MEETRDCKDCERRILSLETHLKISEDEISSLRASRHEHSNWLNRHNLEINTLTLQVNENTKVLSRLLLETGQMQDTFHTLELRIIQDLNTLQNSLNEKLNSLKVEQRYTTLLTAILAGISVFIGKAIFEKWLG